MRMFLVKFWNCVQFIMILLLTDDLWIRVLCLPRQVWISGKIRVLA